MIRALLSSKRRVVSAALLLSLTLVWSGAATAKAGAATKPLPITIGYQVDAEAAFFLAKESGTFRKLGLDPTYKEFLSGPAELAALANNSIDVGEFGVVPFTAGVAHIPDMVGIMVGDDVTWSNGLVVRPDSGIKSIKDLRGKRVAAVKGSGSYYGLVVALAQQHMTLADIHYLNLSPAVILPTFAHGEADAVWIWAPWVEKLESMGGHFLLAIGNIGAISPDFWASNRRWLATHKEAATLYVEALNDETELIHQDPTRAVKPIQDVMGITRAQAKTIVSQERYSTIKQLLDPSYALTVADFGSGTKGVGKAVKEMAAFLKQQNMIKSFPPLSTAFDLGPMQAAASMH